MYTGSSKRLTLQSWNFADWLNIPYMDCLLHAACVTLTSWGNLQSINRIFTPQLNCVLEIWHLWIHLKASKQTIQIWNQYILFFKLSNILKLCPFSLQRLQNVYIEEYTYSPTVFAWVGQCFEQSKLSFSYQTNSTDLDLTTGFGLVFPRALISHCGQ